MAISKRFCEMMGGTIAVNSEQGLYLARQLHPDLIFLDVMMPRMDGWAVLTALKADADLADVPVVMLTLVHEAEMGYLRGASEYLTKPIDRDRLSAVLRRYRPDGADGADGAVLVVEDNEENRDALSRRLERRGFEVLLATDGRAGVETARSEKPDLVLMDMNMPELDGWEATRQIKATPELKDVPVLTLTAHAMSGDRERALEAGCADYHTKPIEFPKLLAQIETILRERQSGGGEEQP